MIWTVISAKENYECGHDVNFLLKSFYVLVNFIVGNSGVERPQLLDCMNMSMLPSLGASPNKLREDCNVTV